MSNVIARGGTILLLFGGFLSLNAGRFGGLDAGIWKLSILLMLFGLLFGLWGTTNTTTPPDSAN